MNDTDFAQWLFSSTVRNTIEYAAEVLLNKTLPGQREANEGADDSALAAQRRRLDALHPRAWVHEPPSPRYVDNEGILNPECWRLKDKRRDWAVIHRIHIPDGLPAAWEWIAITLPGNGKHEYTGTFRTADEAKAAVEARLVR